MRADAPAVAASLAEGCDRLRVAPAAPIAFVVYFELARAVAADDLPTLARLAAAWLDALMRPPLRRIVALADEDLGAGQAARVASVIDDEGAGLALRAVAGCEAAAFAERFTAADALLQRVAPELAGEVDVFGRVIVLAESSRPDRDFGGAASLFLWGALVINPAHCPNPIALAEALVHEAAHALLFGLASGEPLTRNGADERYASPLRTDPRPIEGIVHATFVIARMLLFYEAVIPHLRDGERRWAEDTQARYRRLLADGLTVVDAHADFPSVSHEIFTSCRAAVPLR